MFDINYKADLTDLRELTNLYPHVSQRMRHRRLDQAGLLLERSIREETPEGIGDPIHIKTTIISQSVKYGEQVKVSTPILYALPLGKGVTKGHSVSKAGRESLLVWVERKLGFSGQEAKRITAAIVWNFKKGKSGGTHFTGSHMFEKGFKKSESKIKNIIAQIPDDIVQELNR